MAKRTKTSNAPALTSPLPPADVQTFEVFGRPNAAFGLIRTDSREASCFNGQVAVTRYRVTIEAIPEPVEVVAARVEALMRGTTNHHTKEALVGFWNRARATVPGWPDRSLEWSPFSSEASS